MVLAKHGGDPGRLAGTQNWALALIASANRKMTAAGRTSMGHSLLAGQPSMKAVFWEIR